MAGLALLLGMTGLGLLLGEDLLTVGRSPHTGQCEGIWNSRVPRG